MRAPRSVRSLEDLGRIRLSDTFFLRDFLHSEISNFFGIPNIPTDPDLTVRAGRLLCQNLLEPLQDKFGRLAIRSGYRSRLVTETGNRNGIGASPPNNVAYHIWDEPDQDGQIGAGVCLVVPALADAYQDGLDWRSFAWWTYDNLEFNHLQFFPKLCAFNIQWHPNTERRIDSYIQPRGCLTKQVSMGELANRSAWYEETFLDKNTEQTGV